MANNLPAQANAFTDIEVGGGAPALAATQSLVSPVRSSLAATDQQRAIAETQAAMVVAQSRPRNESLSRDKLLNACQRASLASGAVYQYPRGNQSVSGPSIRLAEAAARAWGNMIYGFRELSRGEGNSECEAFAWDLETNTKAVRQFAVKHWRDTRSGGYALKDERDIYELMANQAQRRVRATILEIVPGDIIEDAVKQCEETLKASVKDLKAAVAGVADAFAKFGVSKAAIEKRLGHRLSALQPAQIISLRKIHTSISDGFSTPEDWFEMDTQPSSNTEDLNKVLENQQPSAPAEPKKQPKTPDLSNEKLCDEREKLLGELEATGHALVDVENNIKKFLRNWSEADIAEIKKRFLSVKEA